MNKNSKFKGFYDKYQVWLNVILIFIVGLLLVWVAFVFMDIWTNHGETAQVPNVTQRDFYDARNLLENYGFEVDVDSVFDPHIKPGQVIDQSPKPQEVVKAGRTVYLKINSFYPEMKSVDDNLLHISSIQAQRTLQSMGFTRIIVKTMPGENDDEVIDIRYNGRKLSHGTKVPVTAEVAIYVSKAPHLEDENGVEDMNSGEVTDTMPTSNPKKVIPDANIEPQPIEPTNRVEPVEPIQE